MVFQDGGLYLDPEGEIRAGAVFDELIDGGEMPITIGVFVDPGEDRSAEYDAFSDAYASFLLDEILPGVLDEHNVADDPEQWAIGGGSSGGNCAFTVAWLRPDRFRRVFSSLGSFVQIPGGNPYPDLIEREPQNRCGSSSTPPPATSTGAPAATGSPRTCASRRRSPSATTTSG
jgi:enterochelin esterase-like enzyme